MSDENARKRELVYGVFASLQALEKCVGEAKRIVAARGVTQASSTGQSNQSYSAALAQQERFTNAMRRTANKLQFELASSNWSEAVRLLSIFYGLNYLARPEIQATYLALSASKNTKRSNVAPAVH